MGFKKNTIEKNTISLILFIFIFSPRFLFIPVDPSFLIMMVSFLVLLINKDLQRILCDNLMIILFFVLLGMYCVIIENIQGTEMSSNSFSMMQFRIILEIVIPGAVFAYYVQKKKIDLIRLLSVFMIFQFLSCGLMLNFGVKEFIFSKILKLDKISDVVFMIRYFGVGRNYLSSLPLCCTYINIFLFINFFYKQNILSIISFILGNTVLLLNSRTSIVMELVSIFIFIIIIFIKSCLTMDKGGIKRFTKKQKRKIVFFLILFSVLFIYLIGKNRELLSFMGEWVVTGFRTIGKLLHGDKTEGTFKDLFSGMVLPKTNISWIFGTGTLNVGEHVTDIGYIRYLLYGGIIFSTLLYGGMLFLLFVMLNVTHNKVDKIFVVLLAIGIFVGQFKGETFSVNELMRLFFFFYFYFIISNGEIYGKFQVRKNFSYYCCV